MNMHPLSSTDFTKGNEDHKGEAGLPKSTLWNFIKEVLTQNQVKGEYEHGVYVSCDPHHQPQAPSRGRDQAGLCQLLFRPHVRHGLGRGSGLA